MAESSLKKHLWAIAGSVIVTLLMQTAGAIYWAGSINARMANAESAIARCDNRVHELETAWISKATKGP
jgi:hypothetical protein